MEKQFAERAVKKPPGGVSVLPERADEVQELSVRWCDLSGIALIWYCINKNVSCHRKIKNDP